MKLFEFLVNAGQPSPWAQDNFFLDYFPSAWSCFAVMQSIITPPILVTAVFFVRFSATPCPSDYPFGCCLKAVLLFVVLFSSYAWVQVFSVPVEFVYRFRRYSAGIVSSSLPVSGTVILALSLSLDSNCACSLVAVSSVEVFCGCERSRLSDHCCGFLYRYDW